MPIRPENRKHYRTKEWQEARATAMRRAGELWVQTEDEDWVKLDEASCERCGVLNGWTIQRVRCDGVDWWRNEEFGEWQDADGLGFPIMFDPNDFDSPPRTVRVVLTVAHLDHDPTNNSLDNLGVLCQRCHNRHDAAHRAETRARTRAANRGATP